MPTGHILRKDDDTLADDKPKCKCEAKNGDIAVFVLDRREKPHTLRMIFNHFDLGVLFDDLPTEGPLYPCISQQLNTDVIQAEFDIEIPPL